MARKVHSTLTRALIANIAAPGIEIERAMTKVRARGQGGN
jgi:hypothetical protein